MPNAIPYRNNIPGLRSAFEYPTFDISFEDECCNNCIHFAPCSFNENGWCGKYPSQAVNTDMCNCCPEFRSKYERQVQLKPSCPYCGGVMELSRVPFDPCSVYWYECKECGSTSPHTSGNLNEAYQSAMTRWKDGNNEKSE